MVILVTLLPFYWILRTALSSNNALAADPAIPCRCSARGRLRAGPRPAVRPGGHRAGWRGRRAHFWRYLLNSVVVSTLVTGCQIFFSAMAAYAFARLRWRGRDTFFALFLAGLMVPTIFTLLPNFVLIKQLGLVDSLLGIALPTMFMTPFAVFFLRQFFMNIPARWRRRRCSTAPGRSGIFFRCMLPMASAPVARWRC
jgi:multiple sugar transport system permease protein